MPLLVPLIIAIVALFVGFVLWLHFYIQRVQRQQLQTLAKSHCPSCSMPFGADAAERARQEYLARCHEARRQRPNARINFVRYWTTHCTQCGAESRFDYETESLIT